MTYSEMILEIRNYVRVEGSHAEHLIKGFINESIREFIRLYNWEKLKVTDTITLDDSDSYILDATNLTYNFEREIALISPYDPTGSNESTQLTEYNKYNYQNYLQLSDKSNVFSIHNGYIYVEGNNTTLTFFYMSPGDFSNFPMTNDTDEVPASIYYPDVINKMAVVKFLDNYSEDELARKETELLARKLAGLKSAENRALNEGKFHMIQRGGLG